MNIIGKLLEEHNMSQNARRIAEIFGIDRDAIVVDKLPEPEPRQEWNVEYPAGTALRAIPLHQPLTLSEADIGRIAERVAQINQEAKTSPVLNMSEQQLIEEYRMLSTAQRIRVQRLIGVLLDNKFNEE